MILDEAYVEFSLTIGDPFASLPLLKRYPNLVILRTFSKVYGLAGLRVGYGLCGGDAFRIAVDQVRQPFYLTGAAQAAAVEALKYQDEVERRVVATVAASTVVTEALRERGLWVAESDANFLWVRLAEDGEDGPVDRGAEGARGARPFRYRARRPRLRARDARHRRRERAFPPALAEVL